MVEEIQKTDPRVRIGLLEQAEREILNQVRLDEEHLRRMLAELRATRRLLEEAQGDLSSSQEKQITQTQEEINNQTQALEEMLASSVEERQEKEEEHVVQQNVVQYQAQTAQAADLIETAASQNTIDRLMNLAYTDNWNQQEAQEFFNLKDTITKTMGYDLNPALKQTVDQSYAALQTVQDRAGAQIQENYDPNATPPEPFKPLDFSNDTSYKPKKNPKLDTSFKSNIY